MPAAAVASVKTASREGSEEGSSPSPGGQKRGSAWEEKRKVDGEDLSTHVVVIDNDDDVVVVGIGALPPNINSVNAMRHPAQAPPPSLPPPSSVSVPDIRHPVVPPPSAEQSVVIDAILSGRNATMTSAAGSGKKTTILLLKFGNTVERENNIF
eukprot:CAMPEP_0183296062 /NCGR_PEP_ID=MMETSP0160_2-20130417/3780_1 /TAXON_ID=2839 ORGANISM="Odontella Sinensis, Strain Grunow 1884" /NCGR_SAMPLE_ID=MMETSP0160_2 /ASSEMBLY_ACC=CAM_ASM_000250 /LENGTH=153 /DNA_ID=CAMNT_0025457633 /DNA_START=240 /DNA_END=701 /DNA_ORIENTATION=-